VLSFIVPAYNEEQLLGRTLSAIHRSAAELGEPFEIVVANDGSTDRTAAIAAEHGATVVTVAHRQIAATRNSGARAARGEWLCFVDADTVVNVDVLRAATHALRGGAVGGGCSFRFDGRVPLYARLLTSSTMAAFRWMRLASGCFIFCRRDAFERIGGFDQRLFGAEEAALSWAMHRQGRFVILRHEVLTSGRKLRAHSTGEVLKLLARLAIGGKRSVKSREGLDLWYGDRRHDPEVPRS
jgi:glycosyltransferase involved in cell wall biosynthesis